MWLYSPYLLRFEHLMSWLLLYKWNLLKILRESEKLYKTLLFIFASSINIEQLTKFICSTFFYHVYVSPRRILTAGNWKNQGCILSDHMVFKSINDTRLSKLLSFLTDYAHRNTNLARDIFMSAMSFWSKLT